MRCAIWYHLYNLKNVKNTREPNRTTHHIFDLNFRDLPFNDFVSHIIFQKQNREFLVKLEKTA